MANSRNEVNHWLESISQRMNAEMEAGAAPECETLTVREFLAKFGQARRGKRVVSEIRDRLESHTLRTSPDFEFEYVDNEILIELDVDIDRVATDHQGVDPTVRVGILTAAHNTPVRVAPNDALIKATTIMQMEDYSQLPVMTTPHEVKGMVSWQSIGEAYAQGQKPQKVKECMEEAHEVKADMTLADATDRICIHGYVLVRDNDRKISGIVTAADLANQFKQHADPFLLIGEIEHHLRNLVRRKFTVDEFSKASDGGKEVRGPEDLTIGGYRRLLENKKAWERVGLKLERVDFIERLESVRRIRNEIMHFSPDDHDPEDIINLEKVAKFLRKVAGLQHTTD